MKRLAFFDLEPWEAHHLKRHLHGFKVDCNTEGLTEKNVAKAQHQSAQASKQAAQGSPLGKDKKK